MNNDFLRHLQSITPQGKAEEKKIFIPADKFKEMEDERDESEELDEATRSKYLKLKYGTKGPYGNKVTDDTIELARKKLDANILRRGGASPEAIRRGVANPFGRDHEVDMAKYRFGNKRAKHLQAAINAYNDKAIRAAIKASKKAKMNEEDELDEAYDRKFMKAIRRGDREAEDIALRRSRAAQVRRAGGSEKAQRLAGSGIYNPYETDLNWAKDKFMWDSRAKAASGKRRAKQRKMNEEDELDEATRSKFLKAKYAGDAEKTKLARMKREASILRRGGADQEVVRKELSHPKGKSRRIFSDYEIAKRKFYKRGGESMDRDERFRAVGKKPPRNVSEDIELDEGVKRLRRLRSARLNQMRSQEGRQKNLDAAYDKELAKLSASRLRRGGARKSTIRSFMTDKPTTDAADRAYEKFSRGAMQKANAKGKKIFEEDIMNEGSYVPKQREARWQRKGSRKLLRQAIASGDKKGAEEMKGNIRDAEQFIRSKKMNEAKKPNLNPVKKANKMFKKLKRVAGKAYNVLYPQQDVDYMLTGRKF